MKVSRPAVLCVVFLAFILPKYIPFAKSQERAQVRIVANVELVQLPVLVFDDKGVVATNLQKSDFRLFDDGVEQRILYIERERVPVSFVVLADLSSSMTRKIPFVQEAALSLLDTSRQGEGSPDEYSIFTVAKHSRQLLPFTRDQHDLERRLPLLLTATNESTALFDGVWLGVNCEQRQAANAHRVMIIITDGGDNHSRYNLRETKRLLEEADLPVFAVMAGPSFELPPILMPLEKKSKPFPTEIGSKPQLPNFPIPIQQDDHIGAAERRGPHNMKVLTDVTGGGVFTARHEEDLPRIVRTIGLAVRHRYIISYKPMRGEGGTDGKRASTEANNLHRIRLELYPKERFKNYSVPYYKRSYHSIE